MDTPAHRRPIGQAPRPVGQPPRPTYFAKRDKKKILGFVALGIAVVALIGLVYLGGTMLTQSKSNPMANVKSSQYQAVFLNNNQVYFGKIKSVDEKSIVLEDIYYLQVQQDVQPEDKTQQKENQQLSLAKLGGELHGPEDTMYINTDQVLFWENLKEDGKVVQAIKSNK